MQNHPKDPTLAHSIATLEERLSDEIICLKLALSRLESLQNEQDSLWVREFYEKIIERREAVLRGLTELKQPLSD